MSDADEQSDEPVREGQRADAIEIPIATTSDDQLPRSDAPPDVSVTEAYEPSPDSVGEFDADVFDISILTKSAACEALGKLGKYDVRKVIGHGGMGVVLEAYDESLHRPVAIKMLARQLATSPTARRRFQREARAAAAINHPNVVTIHAVEEHNGWPYIVMEYVAGRSLQDRIRREAPLPLADVLRVGSQIAAGLAAAHVQGVIHRDIKPGNIMLEDNIDRVKITDFGLARIAIDNMELTTDGHQIGTPAYMSPEQVSGKEVDLRSDLFSLGCVLYAMIAGHSPFRGSHSLDAIRKIMEEAPAPLDESHPNTPKFLADIVANLLEKAPAKRFQSAAHVAEALNRYLATLNQTRSDQLSAALRDETFGTPRSHTVPWRALTVGIGSLVTIMITVVLLTFWLPQLSTTRPSDVDNIPREDQLPVADVRSTITVAKTVDAQFRTISDALANAAPGSTIKVLDDATYQESIDINRAEKWRDVMLVAEESATLANADESSQWLVRIASVPGVTLRGFRLAPHGKQFGVLIVGKSEGASIQNVAISAPSDKHWAAIYVVNHARGSQERPIQIRGSTLKVNNIGVDIQGNLREDDCISHVEILDNRFQGSGNHVLLVQSVRDIGIRGNTFIGGEAIVFALQQAEASAKIFVVNNSFYRTDNWLRIGQANPDIQQVIICNNLVIGGQIGLQGFGSTTRHLNEFAANWLISHNIWQPDSPIDSSHIALVGQGAETIELLSHDQDDPNFLRPAIGSLPTSAGKGGEFPTYVGAFPPNY